MVLSTLVVTTVVVQGPLIFVNLVQVETGEIDTWYSAQNRCTEDWACPEHMNWHNDQARGFNYTQIKELYGDEFNVSPRMHISAWLSDTFRNVYFIDLDQEKAINLGVDWPYPDLGADECVLTSDFAELGYKVG